MLSTRKYRPTDRSDLIGIFRSNTPDFFDPSEQKDFEQFLDRHADTYFVAEVDGRTIGGAGYFLENNRCGRISWTLFDPAVHRKGIGREVVQMCIDELRKIDTVSLITVWTSNAAFRFFEKFGFDTVDFQGNFWGPGLDLYKMEMKISSRPVN